MRHQYHYSIPENLNNHRLDKALSELCKEFSRSQIQKAIKSENLKLNGRIISNLSHKVKENDNVEILIIEESHDGIVASDSPLDIVYEDEDLIVINKNANMTVHPGAGNYSDTLVNALLYHTNSLSDVGGEIRPGIVHRLDKDTSGLMVVAKNNRTHVSLAKQIETRELVRRYKALIWGMIKPTSGTISTLIGRSQSDRKKMSVLKTGGKEAITHYKTLEIFCNGLFSLIECKLETGRTHQIRVHLSHIGHSIIGDQTYGNNNRKILSSPASESTKEALYRMTHQALHSSFISFIHPKTEERIEFAKEVPLDYTELVNAIKESN